MTYGLIAICDQSKHSGFTPTTGATLAGALAHQLRYHVQPVYRMNAAAVVWYGSNPSLIPANAWPIYILDSPDVAGALGYHDLDPHGRPYGRVFVDPTVKAGVSLSSVISHETVEAMCDPFANMWADRGQGTSAVAFEACDPVESSSYLINGVEVSNFVTRAWFDPTVTSGPFDHLGHLTRPLSLERGGYQILLTEGQVSQQFGDEYPVWRRELKAAPQPSRTRWRAVRSMDT